MSDIIFGEQTQTAPSYRERVKECCVVDFRSNKTKIYYDFDNEICNSIFWGLNYEGYEPKFSAIKIDQADAFTLHIDNVAVVPRDLFLSLQLFLSGELPESELHAIYDKHKSKGSDL